MKTSKLKNKGFSLVDMIVSVALFVVVMLVCSSAMIGVLEANKKARSIRLAMDNVNFALEDMVRNLRVGSNYYCVIGGEEAVSIPANSLGLDCEQGNYIAFRNNLGNFAFYRLNGSQLEKKITTTSWISGMDDNLTGYGSLTSPDVTISKLDFYVYNTLVDSNKQPRIVIVIQGTAGDHPNTMTTFNLMTSVTQRIRHGAE